MLVKDKSRLQLSKYAMPGMGHAQLTEVFGPISSANGDQPAPLTVVQRQRDRR
jgi:hypothetical protein